MADRFTNNCTPDYTMTDFISEFNKWTDEFYDSEGFKMKTDYKI